MICHPMRPASRVLGEASMKTRLLAGAMALVLFGCSQQRAEDAGSSEAPAMAEAVADAAGGPDVAVTAAPGVAFNYAYAFRLADNRITSEEHTSEHQSIM